MAVRLPRDLGIVCLALGLLGCSAPPGESRVRPVSAVEEEPVRAAPPASGPPRAAPAAVLVEPVAAESSVKPGINAPYFESGALDKYTRILERETREVVEQRDSIIDALGLRKGMAVADVGAGTGLFTTEIAKRVGREGEVFAIDIVPDFLDRIRERVADSQLSNVRVVHGKERETTLAPGSIDLAFLCDTYHHIEYPAAYLRSLRETMRPGATLVLIDLERIEGKTSPDRLKHVRAGKQTVIAEIQKAGFVLQSEKLDLLEENYFLYFRRP